MTTRNPPLSPSPLHLERHEFLEIVLLASEEEDALPSLPLSVSKEISAHLDDPRRWKVELGVEFDGAAESQPTTYSGRLRIAGYFVVHPDYPEEKIVPLVEVTGASILYGACREMLANLTARSANGMVSLPSVSFVPQRRAPGKGEALPASSRPPKESAPRKPRSSRASPK